MISRRKRRRSEDELVLRAAGAEKLAQLGELSAARQALEGDAVAPGTLRTLASLTNPVRRPPLPREPLPNELSTFEPVAPFRLDAERFIKNIRSARRGAAGGPSGMTTEHLRPMMDSVNDMERLCLLGGIMARGEVPVRVEPAIRLGRMTALQKPDGGIRGIVVGDVLRRLIARTMAQQIADAVEAATAPFQYALKTKGGCECVAHILQAVTDMDERATIVSVDGLGAFDLVSRKAMLLGLMAVEGGPQLLPFVRTFYGQPSVFLWEDEVGDVHQIHQGEGGEHGDPLMPLLFSLAQHSALAAAHESFNEFEHLFAFLDDLYTVCLPERVGDRTLLCTMGRPRCGIEEGMSLQRALPCKPGQGCWTKTPLFGEATTPFPMRSKGSKFCGRQWAKLSFFGTTWLRRLRNTLCCSPVFPRFRTCRQRGFSSCILPQRSPIFSSGQWHLISQRSMHLHMTVRCGSAVGRFYTSGSTAPLHWHRRLLPSL